MLRIHFHGNLKIKEAKFSLFDVKTKGSDLAQVLSSEMVDIFQNNQMTWVMFIGCLASAVSVT